MMRIIFIALIPLSLMVASFSARAEIKVETVRSNGGIEAWLVHDKSVPVIAMQFAFVGGAAQDPVGKEGLAQFMAGLLDEGAGPYDSRSFQQKLQTLAISLSFSPDRDYISGSMQTLTANRDEAFDLLRLALTQPRFDKDAVERVRGQISAMLRNRANELDRQAAYAYSAAAFPNHPYGRRVEGTEESLAATTRDDILAAYKHLLARDNLKITVAGDITADELAKLLDKTFGALPEKADLKPVDEIKSQGQGRVIVIHEKGPQSRIQFGGIGPKRRDPDFMASYVLNHMIGGDSFSSHLYKEVREKRGFTYGVYTDLGTLDHAGMFIGSLAVRNEVAGEALKVIQDEIAKFVHDGPTPEELENTKNYLIGYYPLRFDTTAKIASLLLSMRLDEIPASYITEREQLIRAVTADDVRRTADKILKNPFLIVVAGEPKGIEAK